MLKSKLKTVADPEPETPSLDSTLFSGCDKRNAIFSISPTSSGAFRVVLPGLFNPEGMICGTVSHEFPTLKDADAAIECAQKNVEDQREFLSLQALVRNLGDKRWRLERSGPTYSVTIPDLDSRLRLDCNSWEEARKRFLEGLRAQSVLNNVNLTKVRSPSTL